MLRDNNSFILETHKMFRNVNILQNTNMFHYTYPEKIKQKQKQNIQNFRPHSIEDCKQHRHLRMPKSSVNNDEQTLIVAPNNSDDVESKKKLNERTFMQ